MLTLKRVVYGFLLMLGLASAAHADAILHRGNRYEPATLDPQKVNTQYETTIVADLFEGLLAYDPEGRPTLGVADAWSVSADGKRYTFHIRPGLAWSDGTRLGAEDVVFSFRRLMDPKIGARFAQMFYVVKNGKAVTTGKLPLDALGVSAPDAGTVLIELEDPAPYFPELLATAYAAVVPRHAIARDPDGWARAGMPSNGAFTLEAWNREDRIVLARNRKFHDAASVRLDRVAYYPAADPNASLARFKSGEFDLDIEFPSAQLDVLRTESASAIRLSPALATYYLAVNGAVAKLADRRVRRALSLALDRDVLCAKVLRGGEQPAGSFVPPAIANYSPTTMDFAEWPADRRLAEARALMKDAGYSDDAPLHVTVSYTSSQETRRLGVVMAAMWKRIGVEAVLQNVEGRIHFANLRQGDFEIGLAAWLADFNDASNFLYVLQSASVGSNYSRYRNSKFDALMVQAASTADGAARAALMHDAEALAMADQPLIPLYFGVSRALIGPRVVGWRNNPLDYHLSRYLSVRAAH